MGGSIIKKFIESSLEKLDIKFEYKYDDLLAIEEFYSDDFILKYDPKNLKLKLHLNINLLPDEATKVYEIVKKIHLDINDNIFTLREVEMGDIFLDTGEEILFGEFALTYTDQDDIIDAYDDILITNSSNLLINCDILYGNC